MVRGYLPSPAPKDIIYAPIDLAIRLSEGLAERGHAVEYYGPEGTSVDVPIQTMGLRQLATNQHEFNEFVHKIEYHMHYVPAMWDFLLAREMFHRAREGYYDILHFHHPEVALPFAALYPDIPVVYTQHDPLYPWYCDVYSMYRTENQFFVTISDNQRRPRPNLPYAGTVYNGINLDNYEFSDTSNSHLLFVGRIVPDKGVREAVQVAVNSGSKLHIIGPVYPDHQAYFDEHVKPFLGSKIKYLGYVEGKKLAAHYKKAKALLFPIQWEEPFGLTMIEAMACGTPVLAFRRGSVPEVVKHKKTGYVVDTVDEMVAAVKKLDKIDRADCRARVEKYFTTEKMIDGYEKVYKAIIKEFKSKNKKD